MPITNFFQVKGWIVLDGVVGLIHSNESLKSINSDFPIQGQFFFFLSIFLACLIIELS